MKWCILRIDKRTESIKIMPRRFQNLDKITARNMCVAMACPKIKTYYVPCPQHLDKQSMIEYVQRYGIS